MKIVGTKAGFLPGQTGAFSVPALEFPAKMGGIGVAAGRGNFLYAAGGISQQFPGAGHASVQPVGGGGHAVVFFEEHAEVGGGEVVILGNLFKGKGAVPVLIEIGRDGPDDLDLPGIEEVRGSPGWGVPESGAPEHQKDLLQGQGTNFPAVVLGEMLFAFDLAYEGENRLKILPQGERAEGGWGRDELESEPDPCELDGIGGLLAMKMVRGNPDGLAGADADGPAALLIPGALSAEDEADLVERMAVKPPASEAGRLALDHAKPEGGKALYIIHFITRYMP